ncbi:MAG: glycosyltransferase, partial [Burkholderiales bacterium]|nr:glycosyltransferase [Burkholderiales bacterium]
FHPGLETAPRADLVFEGSMAFGPNIDAAVFFVREVLPVIRRSVPSVRLVLVGRDPVPEVRALASDHVEVTGSVPDVRPYVAGSRVFVSPLRFGAGIKNKILQAWSMGKATVATSVSVSGLPAEDGVNLLVRDGVEALAGGVIELLRSEQRCRALGDAGRRLVEAHFSWDAKALEFERALQSARATGNGREAT